jgi:hypothetical protein
MTSPTLAAAAHPRSDTAPAAPRRRSAVAPWIVGLLFGCAHWCGAMVFALQSQLQRFDDGIQLSSVSLLDAGQLPFLDFYSPYGWGRGAFGLPAEWLFGGEALAIHAIYALAPAMMTCLACAFGWRRAGAIGGVALAVLTLSSSVYRYTLTWCVVLAFALLIDGAIRRTTDGTLQNAVAHEPRRIAVAGAVLGLAGAARPEYAVLSCMWAAVLAFSAGTASRWARAALPGVAVAVLPYLAIVAAGGDTGVIRYLGYVLFDFGTQRGRPVTWATFTGGDGYQPAVESWLVLRGRRGRTRNLGVARAGRAAPSPAYARSEQAGAVRGADLPDGLLHTGAHVRRDSGSARGPDRVDRGGDAALRAPARLDGAARRRGDHDRDAARAAGLLADQRLPPGPAGPRWLVAGGARAATLARAAG